MRAVFFGTPPIAVPALRALTEIAQVVGVVCQPDRPAGRGLSLAEPAVKSAARELGLSVHQPVKVKTGNLDQWLAELRADVAVVLAYGRILPKAVLDAPRRGCVNLHASLLPKYRGAAPIQWAVIRGETTTGVSLMQMDEGMDTGPVYTRHELEIFPEETSGELAERLADLAASVVREDIPRAVAGELRALPQNDPEATLAPPIRSEDALVDWQGDALQIVNLVRGMAPRPGARTIANGKLLKLFSVRGAVHFDAAPGSLVLIDDRPLVSSGRGAVEILSAQLEGRTATSGRALVHGRVLRAGMRLGAPA
jgi:methionyl-tRNA formyltransferase